MDIANQFVPEIYDCAADPERWPAMLVKLCEHLNGAYGLIGFADFSDYRGMGPPPDLASRTIHIHSPWDKEQIRRAGELFAEIPGVENYVKLEADQSWSQMEVLPEQEFKTTKVYQKFCQPQGLRDCLNLNMIKRPGLVCGLVVTRRDNAPLFDADEKRLVETLSPHFRRAVMINDVADKGRLALTLYKKMLDQLATAVFLIGLGGKVEFSNGKAEDLLRDGNFLLSRGGRLTTARSPVGAVKMDEALSRAAIGDAALGIAGIGVPLLGVDGARAAAYVLPLGKSEVRNEMGKGYCAVFVAQRGEHLPVLSEVLRTLYDLTPTEAKISVLIADGSKPLDLSQALDLSINTIRTHLSRVFSKTGTKDQLGLVELVKGLSPPVMLR
jgi:DNA-binding CsgD family transcriptional regulator